MKTGVFRNFAKFTRKHLCQSLFFNKKNRFHPELAVYFQRLIKNTKDFLKNSFSESYRKFQG